MCIRDRGLGRRVCREVGAGVVNRESAAREQVDEAVQGRPGCLGPARARDRERRSDDGVGGVAGLAGGFDRGERHGAVEVDVRRDGDVDQGAVAIARPPPEQGEDEVCLLYTSRCV